MSHHGWLLDAVAAVATAPLPGAEGRARVSDGPTCWCSKKKSPKGIGVVASPRVR